MGFRGYMAASLFSIRRLAEIFGVNERTIRSWVTGLEPDQVAGKGGGRGRHLYSVPRIIEHHFAPRDANGEVLDLNAERARVAKEQADKLERDNAIARGDSLEWSKLRPVLIRLWSDARTKLLAMPRKAAPLVVGLQTMPEIEAILDDQIREALEAASEVDDLGDDGHELDPGSAPDGSEAATEADDR